MCTQRIHWGIWISLPFQRTTSRETVDGSRLVGKVRFPSSASLAELADFCRCGQDQFVLKDIPKDIFDNFHEKIWPQLQQCSFIRLPCDTIPGQRIFVYRYLTSDFLNLVKEGLPPGARKRILRPSLQGIAEFHGRDVAHLGTPHCITVGTIMFTTRLDIKPDISWLNASPVVKIPRLNGFRSSTLRMPLTFPKADASKVCLRAMTIGEVLRRTSKASLISQRTFSHLGLS